MTGFNLKQYIEEKRSLVDSYLRGYFSKPFKPERLYESITYSLFAGGKRLRPILALAAYEACGGEAEELLPQASAIELIHTYSLIHDDLPAMDDDDLRRGKPTNHRVFGEAMAILAGDALLTEAFYMFTEGNVFPAENIKAALRVLAGAAGAHGMVGGQAEDILSENKEPDEETLEFIHLHKTAALIRASVCISPVLKGEPEEKIQAMGDFGRNIGLAFQIVDDILDIIGDEKRLGKKTGADLEKGKMTYPALYGIEESKNRARTLVDEAISKLKVFDPNAIALKEIARYIINRME
ncbi:MAG: polyprenyl synthetase family protein [Nitrospirae bacterium]|nr:MAG: polyprenyl synthetase family protein [Nitrospirota bacterium]